MLDDKSSELIDDIDCIESKLDEADQYAKSTDQRLPHDEVFDELRKSLYSEFL
jgi:hypothetical protein